MTAWRVLLGAAFVFAVCLAAGRLLFQWLAVRLRGGERVYLEFLTGAALVSTAMFALASVHLVYTSVLVAAGGLLPLCAWWFRRPAGAVSSAGARLTPLWRTLFVLTWLTFGALYLITAMTPETSPDGVSYHVGLISRYYQHRGFYFVDSMFGGLAEGVEMLFLPAFALGRHSATAVVHLLFLLTLPFGMLAYGRRIGLPAAGVVGSLLFYLAPVVGRDGTIAYVDVATAAVVFGVYLCLEIWRRESLEAMLVPAGLLAGFSYACKLTASPIAVFLFIYMVAVTLARRDGFPTLWRRAGVTTLPAILVAGPWIVRNAILFHNPFFPLFNNWFPNPHLYPIIESELRRLMAQMGGVPLAKLPWEATVGGKLAGVIGPVFLLAPLALLSVRHSAGRLLLLAFLPLFLPFFSNNGGRFLIPSLPFLAMALAVGIVSIPRLGPGLAVMVVLAHAVLSWPDLMDRWSPGFQWRIDNADWRAALRITPENVYLREHWRDYLPGLMLDRLVAPGEVVFSPAMGQLAYHHRELLGTYESSKARLAFLYFITPLEQPLANTFHREIHFPAVKTDRVRLVTRSTNDNDLRIEELRFALGKSELPREAAWRITASANPWETPLAFDNGPLSFWTSGRTVTPGLWLETDFGHMAELDRLLVAQSEDQRWTSLGVEAMEDGKWTRLHSRESDTVEPARASVRMEARDELKRMGIRWILIPDGAYGADDLLGNPAIWGVTQVAVANGFRLWKLN